MPLKHSRSQGFRRGAPAGGADVKGTQQHQECAQVKSEVIRNKCPKSLSLVLHIWARASTAAAAAAAAAKSLSRVRLCATP